MTLAPKGDSIGFTNESEESPAGSFTVSNGVVDLESCQWKFKDQLQTILDDCNATEYVLTITGNTSFRKMVAGFYKSHRGEKPQIITDIKNWVMKDLKGQSISLLEGDDIMGMLQDPSGESTIICTVDKDLKQIPGLHYHLKTREKFFVTPDEGTRFFYQQVLAGDTADGYPGCPNIGNTRAIKIIQDVPIKYLWDIVVYTYEYLGGIYKDAVTNAKLAYILHPGDKATHQWMPPALHPAEETELYKKVITSHVLERARRKNT